MKTYYEKQSSGRYSVDGTVSDWVKVPYNEARYGRSNGVPCDDNICTNTWNLITDAVTQWVASQKAAGQDRRPDQVHAAVLRPVGPLRLRCRRQLQRAGRVHRPLPDRALRRRPGRRGSAPGRGRDLVAPLVRVPEHLQRTGREQARRHPDRQHRAVDRRLHDPAGERRSERLRPRVRARPRSAGPLRHLRSAEPEPGELVERDGAVPVGRQGCRRDRAEAAGPRHLGQDAAGLARLRDGQGGPDQDDRARPARVQLEEGPGRGRRTAEEEGDHATGQALRRHASRGGAARATSSRTRSAAR